MSNRKLDLLSPSFLAGFAGIAATGDARGFVIVAAAVWLTLVVLLASSTWLTQRDSRPLYEPVPRLRLDRRS